MDFNHFTALGRLTRDVETSVTPNKKQVAKFGFATSTGYGDNKKPLFIDAECWGKTAEIAAKYLSKGKAIHISGELQMDMWESQEGQKRSKIKVTVRDITFLPGEQKSSPQPQPQPADDDVPF
jgi:single-strand DNA-binding protein